MAEVSQFDNFYDRICRAGANGPDQVANVLSDARPGLLVDIAMQRFAEARQQAQFAAALSHKPTHTVWTLRSTTEPTAPRIRVHDYSLHKSPVDYAAAAQCSPELHAELDRWNGPYAEQWHNHRYGWFVAVTLSENGYTEDRIKAPQDAELTQGEMVPYWQPGPTDLQRKETKKYRCGEIAIMGLNDLHRLRKQCGALTLFVQGPVEREASTVFDDNLNPLWQPNDFGPSREADFLRRLRAAGPPDEVKVNPDLL